MCAICVLYVCAVYVCCVCAVCVCCVCAMCMLSTRAVCCVLGICVPFLLRDRLPLVSYSVLFSNSLVSMHVHRHIAHEF